MPSLELKLLNDLEGENVKVEEMNSGVVRRITEVAPGQIYKLCHLPNATHREFVFVILPNRKKLRSMTTDDFHLWKEISIYKDNVTNTYDWRGSVRRHHSPATEAPQASNTTSNTGRKFATVWQEFLSKFGL